MNRHWTTCVSILAKLGTKSRFWALSAISKCQFDTLEMELPNLLILNCFPAWHDILKKCSQALLLRRKGIFAPSYMGKLKKSQVIC
jgi:hypothetical protein